MSLFIWLLLTRRIQLHRRWQLLNFLSVVFDRVDTGLLGWLDFKHIILAVCCELVLLDGGVAAHPI